MIANLVPFVFKPFRSNSSRRFLYGLIFAFLCVGPDARAFSVQLFGDALLSQPTNGVSTGTFKPVAKYGFGGTIGFGIGAKRRFEFELGSTYNTRAFIFDIGTSQVTLSYPILFNPVALKFWLFRYMNVNLGGYASIGLGQVGVVYGQRTFDIDFATLGIKTLDYGILGGVGFRIPVKKIAFIFDYKYCYGLPTNLSGSTLYYTDHHFSIGMRFFGNE